MLFFHPYLYSLFSFDLPETKGAFQLKGVVSGMEKDTAFKEIKTKSGKPMRMLNFGTSYLDGETLYVNLQGMEQENVYFSKRAEKKGEKADTEKYLGLIDFLITVKATV